MTRTIIIIVGFLSLPQSADAQKRCKKGIPCGNSCISASKTCRIGTGTATPEPTYTPPPPAPSPAARPLDDQLIPLMRPADERDPRGWVTVEGATIYYPNQYTCEPSQTLRLEGRIYFRTQAEAQRAGYRRSEERGCR